jgi:hypothetical protein
MRLDAITDFYPQDHRKGLNKTEKNFLAAWVWVKQKYPELYRIPHKIVVMPQGMSSRGSYNRSTNQLLINTIHKPSCEYTKHPGWFINTLIHELTHSRQFKVDKTDSKVFDPKSDNVKYRESPHEKEARAAGDKAWMEWQKKPLKWEDVQDQFKKY